MPIAPATNGTLSTIDESKNQIDVDDVVGFTTISNQLYDIRRIIETATSSGIEIEQGNDVLISDVLNVYTDGDTDGYVASNSLPSYDIKTNIVEEVLVGSTDAGLEGFNPLNQRYSFI